MPDLHAWIIDENKNIIDWDFEEYKFTKDLLDLTDECCYEMYDTKKQIECASYIKKQVDKRKLIEGDNFDTWLDKFYACPVKGMCYYNSLAYKKHNPKCKIAFGKFGWKRKDGEPYWEYGDFDGVAFKVDLEEMIKRAEYKMRGMNNSQKIKFIENLMGR